MFLYTSCKEEDKDCISVVTAKYLSDTMQVVPNSSIIIEEGDIFVTGFTDANGQFRYTFPLEAILGVHALIDTSSFDSLAYPLEGSTSIRLRPGETIYRSVFLSPI